MSGWFPRGEEAMFFRYCVEGRLMIQRCQVCRTHVFPPRSVCPHCHAGTPDWVEALGTGEVHTYSVEMRPAQGDQPYVLAIVDLDEGVRLLTRLDCPPEDAFVGQRVGVTFQELEGQVVPIFQPVALP